MWKVSTETQLHVKIPRLEAQVAAQPSNRSRRVGQREPVKALKGYKELRHYGQTVTTQLMSDGTKLWSITVCP